MWASRWELTIKLLNLQARCSTALPACFLTSTTGGRRVYGLRSVHHLPPLAPPYSARRCLYRGPPLSPNRSCRISPSAGYVKKQHSSLPKQVPREL
ncbi:hypothetical protein C8T65DRAFT_11549 [Cerioporus squamosus]|nr:hypothetical protein C8T65DRAFT_11549 [Cerioporus squamosus]